MPFGENASAGTPWFDVSTHQIGVLHSAPDGGPGAAYASAMGSKILMLYRSTCQVTGNCWRLGELDPDSDTFQEMTVGDTGMPASPAMTPVAYWDATTRPEQGCPTGCVYAFIPGAGTTPATIYSVDPTTKLSRTIGTSTMTGGQALALHGTVAYLLGGLEGSVVTDKVWRFDPSTQTLVALPNRLPWPQLAGGVAANEDGVYLLGGFKGLSKILNVSYFDFGTETAHEVPWQIDNYKTALFAGQWGTDVFWAGGIGSRTTNEIWVHHLPNDAPTLALSASPSAPTVGDVVQLAAGAADDDGTVANITWSLSDGTTAYGPSMRHAWMNPGDPGVTVRATDNEGASTSATLVLHVSAQPTASPTSTPTETQTGSQPSSGPSLPPEADHAPQAVVTCKADGLTVTCQGTASDPDGDALDSMWNFGEGPITRGTQGVHTYAKAGNVTVTWRVSDGQLTTVTTAVLNLRANPVMSPTVAIKGPNDPKQADTMAPGVLAKGSTKATPSLAWLGIALLLGLGAARRRLPLP